MDSDTKEPGATGTISQAKLDFIPNRDLWYSDGSVVLVAEKTAFRVHSTILAAHSEVFRDMFAIPQPILADPDVEIYESCQVLHLQDSPADLGHFLKSIYDLSYFIPGKKTKFPIVSAVLRLSTKYHTPVLRQRAIDLLVTVYPSSAEAWQLRSLHRLVPPFEDEHLAYIELAVETDVRVILPAIYYAATREPLSGVVSTLARLRVAPSEQWNVTSNFLLGRDRLAQAEMKYILAFLDKRFPRPNCQGGNDSTTLVNLAHTTFRKVFESEPYHHWCSARPAEVGPSLPVCKRCSAAIRNSIELGRQKIWENLPGFFGLPDWETLRARDGLDDLVFPSSPQSPDLVDE